MYKEMSLRNLKGNLPITEIEGTECFYAAGRFRVIQGQQNSTSLDAGYLDRLGPSGKFVENSTRLTCLEIAGYRIKYSTVLWLIELQIRGGRNV